MVITCIELYRSAVHDLKYLRKCINMSAYKIIVLIIFGNRPLYIFWINDKWKWKNILQLAHEEYLFIFWKENPEPFFL